MRRLKTSLGRLLRDTNGASAVEYALIAALISVGAIVFMTQVGLGVNAAFQEVCTALNKNISTVTLDCSGE